MRRPSGTQIRNKKSCEEKEKLTSASEGIFVDEGGATGCYRGTIATRNRIGGGVRVVRVATAGAVTTGVIDIAGLSVLALMEGQREGNCDSNRHKSTGGNSQP